MAVEYDSKGRLSSVKDTNGYTESYSYASPDRNEVSSISYPDETNKFFYYDSSWRLIRESDASGHVTYYNYDAIGNPLDYVRDLSFSWERGRLLGSVYSRSDGDPIACYTYNPSGIRTSKTVYVNGVPQTTYYTLDGDTVVREECGSDVIWYYYDAAGALIGFELNGEPYYYIKNVQGDIIRIIDKTGYTVVSL